MIELATKQLTKVRSTAIDVRQAFDKGTVPRPLLRELYLEYNPDVLDLDQFLSYATDIFPKGNCGIASIYLRHVLGQGIVTEGQYLTEQHQFLQLGKVVVDITADQFGGPPVYVGPLELPWNLREF
jgi:hypothetical protein